MSVSFFYGHVPRACVPIVAAEGAEAVRQAEAIRAHEVQPDLVELRADHLRDLATANVAAVLRDIRAALGDIPLLVTNRRRDEGGAWGGDEAARLALLSTTIASGHVAFVDVELATEDAARARLLAEAREAGVAAIISAHDLAATPEDAALDRILADLSAAGGAAAKLATTAGTSDDALRLLRATARAAKRSPVPLITMAMGAAGSITRLAGPFFGSALTFATIGPPSAPGQMPLTLVRDYWRATGLRA